MRSRCGFTPLLSPGEQDGGDEEIERAAFSIEL